MSIGVIVESRFKPGTDGVPLLTQKMKERFLAVTRKSDGCESVHLYAEPGDSDHLFLLEDREPRAKYERYSEWVMAQPTSDEGMSLLEREPVWTHLDDTGAQTRRWLRYLSAVEPEPLHAIRVRLGRGAPSRQ